MFPSPPSAVRRRRGVTALGALAVTGALLLSPALTAASAAPATGVVADELAASQLTLSSTTVTTGDSLSIEYTTDRPTQNNWVAIYPASADEPCSGCGFAWAYAPGTSGEVTVALEDRGGNPLPAGEYRIEYLFDDAWTRVSDPAPFTIEADTALPEQPQAGDPDAPVTSTPITTDVTTDGVIAREGFTTDGAPVGWSVETDETGGSDDYRGWTFTTRADWTSSVDEMRGRFARPLGALVVADAQQFGGSLNTTLTSAAVSVDDLASARLTFDSHYRGAADQSGAVSVSFDGAEPSEILRLDSESVSDDYDALQMNYEQDVVFEVPEGAEEAVFSWEFVADEGTRYWAIDSVAVHAVQKATDVTPTQAWVMSDIQGHPADFQHALGDYSELAPDADGMLIVGDLVNSGTSAEWQEIYDVMDATADIRPRQTIAAIGNHERYAPGGFDANRDRFLSFAERDAVWDEYVLEGQAGDLPVIVLGQEFAGPTDVAMSDAQVEFFEERLAHWTELDKQVVVMTHFPLGETVSASWIPWYSDHHQMNDRLTAILGNFPNAVLFSGHTHYPAELGDWAVQRRTAGGHPDGFTAINTLAMHVEWDAVGENTVGINEVTTGDINRGLTLDAYGDRIVVTAYDFATDAQLRQIEIPNPLVAFDADTRPTSPIDPVDPVDPTDPIDPTDPADPVEEGPAAGGGSAGAPDGSDSSGSGDLAVTGAETPWGVWAGAAVLIALGATLLVLRRRRIG